MPLGSFASAGLDSKRHRAVPLPRTNASMKTFTPDSSIASDVIPSANYGDRNKGRAARHDRAALHRHARRGRRDRAAVHGRHRRLGALHRAGRRPHRSVRAGSQARLACRRGVWAGEEDINSCSIGVEIINRGHDWGYPDFPLRQIAAVIALCRGIMLRRKIPSHRVLAHSDVAPARKKDPGEKFPWHSLANSGRRALGAAGADRARRNPEARHHQRRRPRHAARRWPNTATASRHRENTTPPPWKWSPPSSGISAPPASMASPIIRR